MEDLLENIQYKTGFMGHIEVDEGREFIVFLFACEEEPLIAPEAIKACVPLEYDVSSTSTDRGWSITIKAK